MDIKLAAQSRVARYGIALGLMLYATWSGLLRIFVPRESDFRRPRGWRGSL